ncbi:uncharacterized protein LOC110834935 [Zootermopsis nevadensis]|uniref:FXPRL-amide n=1 Tax=Zootermopsis nevadensis TaxID=136037 RepID=A0A067R6S8_ZOONE|nr:uncharacterized protein LOC110834935 [Zootermopsis nevadensis]KDR13989.1 hypothetical protein L798_12162 [Zootermopsis nevadensis]
MKQILFSCAMIHVLLLVSSVQCDEESDSVSTNTDAERGSSGLIPMPRVGRSDLAWTLQRQGDTVPSSLINRRSSSGLISMPRVGRGFLGLAPGVRTDPYLKDKRGSSGLIPMPRVGRSDVFWPLTDAFNVDGNKVGGLEKNINGDAGKTSTGMWFGPRLGKRREGNIDIPWAIVTVKEIPADVRDYTPYLTRESEGKEDYRVLLDEELPVRSGRIIHGHE